MTHEFNGKMCEECCDYFFRTPRLSSKQWSARRFCSKECSGVRSVISNDKVCELYNSGKSSSEIGEIAKLSGTQILRILHKCGVNTRGHSENKKLSHSKPETRKKLSFNARNRVMSEESKDKLRALHGEKSANWSGGMTITGGGYLSFTASEANGELKGRLLHAVIAEWFYARKVKDGECVHHIDGNKLNNHPENLTIITSSEHMKLHHKQGDFKNE